MSAEVSGGGGGGDDDVEAARLVEVELEGGPSEYDPARVGQESSPRPAVADDEVTMTEYVGIISYYYFMLL